MNNIKIRELIAIIYKTNELTLYNNVPRKI